MARVNFGAKPKVYPQPVFIVATYDENGVPDAMNAAWGGINEEDELFICMGADHKTTENFMKTGAFTVSVGDAKHVVECDYLGVVSGKTEPNKLEKSGFTVTKSELVNAPIINELAVCVECTVKSYDEETCRLIGKIVNVSVDESAMTDGKVDISKVQPIAYDSFNHDYNLIGEKVGNAFEDGLKLK